MASSAGKRWLTESYIVQRESHWPKEGRHILAQFDQESVVVYQAYCPEIADYAVKHQCFGGPKFSYSRMSWIKTNFLWMMYRSGWATKIGQERVLAVWLKREAFDKILSLSLTGHDEKVKGIKRSPVRLQWDPDHTPTGMCEQRRAIQLGLRDEVLASYGKDWIVEIKDVTEFVAEQYEHVKRNRMSELMVAQERVYPVPNEETAAQIKLDPLETHATQSVK